MIDRALCEAAFHDAVAACDPAVLVERALAARPIDGPIVGLAVGKAALAMARGAPPVARGLAVAPADDGRGLPATWRLRVADHPLPGPASVDAGRAALALVEGANAGETILALISGGASALLELPAPGVDLDELRRRTREVMASGAPIHELNRVRTQLSALKGGKLAGRARVPLVTLVASDVIGDDPRVVGSGPTVRAGDRVEVIAPMARFSERVHAALAARGVAARLRSQALTELVDAVAAQLASEAAPLVAWGEPTVRVPPDAGQGGRAQQLALVLARHLRGTSRSAFVAGSDGIDGTSHAAGAYVDGTTWDAIATSGISPDDALARCDATPALGAVGALFVTGPTGVNHADVVVLG